jgi:predicted transposase YdaD
VVKKADIGGKRLLGLAPDTWVQWVTQQSDVVALEILGSEFQWVSRENDVLMKVYSPTHGEFLILTELQLRYTIKMPLRVRAYIALAEEKYELPVFPVLVNILPPPQNTDIPDRFESNFLGIRSLQDYCVINLWEVDVETVFERSIDTLLPFVPILKNGGSPETVRRALTELQQNEELVELESLLGFFASFVLDTELVSQIMRWDMTVLRESPWYQEILQEGRKGGIQEGRQTGIQEGEQVLVLRQLTRRIGLIAPPLETQIRSLSLPQLEELGEALLDFTQPTDLENWLQSHS